MHKPFLNIARVIIVLNIVLAVYLIMATTTYLSTMLSMEPTPQPPMKALTIPINTTVIPAQIDEALDRNVESTATGVVDRLMASYGVGFYLLQTLALTLGLLLGVISIALIFEFKASRSRKHLERVFQVFKAARIWYISGLISASILLTCTILIYRLGYGLITYLMLVFESSALVFFTWRLLHIHRFQNELLRLIGIET